MPLTVNVIRKKEFYAKLIERGKKKTACGAFSPHPLCSSSTLNKHYRIGVRREEEEDEEKCKLKHRLWPIKKSLSWWSLINCANNHSSACLFLLLLLATKWVILWIGFLSIQPIISLQSSVGVMMNENVHRAQESPIISSNTIPEKRCLVLSCFRHFSSSYMFNSAITL